MSEGSKTIIEWNYSPASFFEAPIETTLAGGKIQIQDGKVKGVFEASHSGQREFRDKVHELLQTRFIAQQVLTHKKFELAPPSMSRVRSDSRRDVTVFVDSLELKVTARAPDILLKDKNGNVISDTRAERLEKQGKFGAAVMHSTANDPTLIQILKSFNKATNDPENLLVHLYEIREAIAHVFGGEAHAQLEVGVSKKDWKWFGRLANQEPLIEGRHRGKHKNKRKLEPIELSKALGIAQALIEGYVEHLSRKSP